MTTISLFQSSFDFRPGSNSSIKIKLRREDRSKVNETGTYLPTTRYYRRVLPTEERKLLFFFSEEGLFIQPLRCQPAASEIWVGCDKGEQRYVRANRTLDRVDPALPQPAVFSDQLFFWQTPNPTVCAWMSGLCLALERRWRNSKKKKIHKLEGPIRSQVRSAGIRDWRFQSCPLPEKTNLIAQSVGEE